MASWGLYKRAGACWSYTGIIGVPLDTGSGSGTLAESAAVPTLASAAMANSKSPEHWTTSPKELSEEVVQYLHTPALHACRRLLARATRAASWGGAAGLCWPQRTPPRVVEKRGGEAPIFALVLAISAIQNTYKLQIIAHYFAYPDSI